LVNSGEIKNVSFFFHRFGETISRHFHNILNGILMLEGDFSNQPYGSEEQPHILCVLCEEKVESASHLFLTCNIVGTVRDKYHSKVVISVVQHNLPKHCFNHFGLLELNVKENMV